MLVTIFHRLFPTCGWIFSSSQEAGSRTASLKRSNQVRGLRHSHSVSSSVKWDSSTSFICHCHQQTWSLISFFFVYFASIQKKNEWKWKWIKQQTSSQCWHILRRLHFESVIQDIEMTLMLSKLVNWIWTWTNACYPYVNIPSKSSQEATFLALQRPCNLLKCKICQEHYQETFIKVLFLNKPIFLTPCTGVQCSPI